MTKKEVAELITIMQANYANEFRGMSDEAINGKINLWLMQFRDDDYKEVLAAVMAYMATDDGDFMPKVGQIKKKLVEVRTGEELTELEAWNLVHKALRNCSYNSVEEFNKLPAVIQRLVGDPMQLKDWAALEDKALTVVASNFQRSYKVRAASEREYLALPSAVRETMNQIASGMKMPALPKAPTDQERQALIQRVMDA